MDGARGIGHLDGVFSVGWNGDGSKGDVGAEKSCAPGMSFLKRKTAIAAVEKNTGDSAAAG